MFAQVEYFLYDLAERIVKNAYNMLFFVFLQLLVDDKISILC